MRVRRSLGKVLGFFVSQCGIEVDPDQIKVFEGIPELLITKKQVQRLTGRIAALSRFISHSSDRCHKFFGMLKKYHSLEWTPKCIQDLQELKAYLSLPPLLSKPEPRKQLLVYLAISEVVITTEICRILPEFDECQLDQIPRVQNIKVDSLAKLASTTKSITTENKSVVHLLNLSLDQIMVRTINLTWDWRRRIIAYLQYGTLPSDKKEAKKLRMQADRYSLLHSDLYKRTYGAPLVKCLGPKQDQRILEEVYEGHCSAHSGN
uniref:Uncharacterized protein LOC104222315 n=1 Tax=Nicotiana sylvestris TaxID=4096 RepID=A0A1U7VZQ0_NICSY|nr:PREDICTED: uncharacterized protein LOC104222315 [Nicotiana sylvestris]